MTNEEIFEQLSETSLLDFGKEAMLRDELEALRKFHDFFTSSVTIARCCSSILGCR